MPSRDPAVMEPEAVSGPADSPTPRQSALFFAIALLAFLATRLIGLERFPIYFFCDEAVQSVQAANLWNNGFRDDRGTLLPTYLRNTEFYNLSLGVYLRVLPERLLPRSVAVTRGAQVLVLLTAMAAVGLILRDFFRLRFWWVGVLVLSVFPGWFLHNRIAFELMLATACYVWFLYFYLRYRSGRPRAVFPALLFLALTFYGYNTFQPVTVATAVILAAVDAPYHWRQRRTIVWALLFGLLLTVPYWRFLRQHPGEVAVRLRSLDSYWTRPGRTLGENLVEYGRQYAAGFSPRYWFFPEPPGDIERHIMKGYPHVPVWVLPLAAAGVLLCLRRAREPAPRTLLVAMAVAPIGAAIARPGITRAMTLVVVIAMLAAIAIDPLARFLARRTRPVLAGAAILLGLCAVQAVMLGDALRNGPTWYRDYGLYGMQWGAREMFGAVARHRAAHPDALFVVSPVWANGVDDLREFFLPGAHDVVMANMDWLRYERRDIPAKTLAVLIEPEYQGAAGDARFESLDVAETIPYPDGSPGFRLVWVRYAPDFEAVLAREREAWHRLVDSEAPVLGETARVSHSAFDIGEARHLFDGESGSLARTEHANPAVVEVRLPSPRRLRGVRLTTGTMQYELTLAASGPGGTLRETRTYRDLPADPTVEIALPGSPEVSTLRIEVRDIHSAEPASIHLRELELLAEP